MQRTVIYFPMFFYLIKVRDLSASDDVEAQLISKMKQKCGYEYTNKLQSMYQDIAVSKNLADKYRQKVKESNVPLAVVFDIKVLSTNAWPLTHDNNINLPIELIPVIDRFTAFYLNEFSGRKLKWSHKLSKVELMMKGLKLRYTIKVKFIDNLPAFTRINIG